MREAVLQKLVMVVVCVAAVIVCSPHAGAAVVLNPQEQEFVTQVNDVRIANGVRPVVVDDNLSINAQQWAQAQADDNALSHQVLSATTFDMARRAENVAFGQTVPSMQERLLASPLHRANILNPAFDRFGIGVRSTATGGMYVTQSFGG